MSFGTKVGWSLNRFVENGSLLHTLKAFGEFPEALVASYVVKILEGLNHLHKNRIVVSSPVLLFFYRLPHNHSALRFEMRKYPVDQEREYQDW